VVHSDDKQIDITLVYLGNKLPKYVRANLQHLSNTFPQANVWLITDSQRTKENIEKLGIKTWLFTDSDVYWSEINHGMNFPSEFRNGFWFLTLKRFKALEMFMQLRTGPVLHVEADVFLLPNFPIMEILRIEKDMAFPIVGSGYAIASTLFLRNFETVKKFNIFVEEQTKINENAIDMTLLYDYQKRFPDRVEILPSGPSSDSSMSGYFDGAAFGTYLIGQDPRNYRARTLKYSPIEWHVDKVQNFEYRIIDEALYVRCGQTESPLYSLHLHTKNPKLFEHHYLLKRLRVAITQHANGVRKVLAPRVLWPVLIAALHRRLKRTSHGS
jgi:hypothetical protein